MSQQSENPIDYRSMEHFFRNGNLFQFMWKWRWVFLITFFASVVLAIVFSGPRFITPKFKSEAIIYPINLNEYSDESHTEQMLQILQSTELKFRLIDVFNLYEHYRIDPEDPHAQSYILDELNDHVSISRTSYESVRITVLDKDPLQAAAMADSINVFYNQLTKSIEDLRTLERIKRDTREMTKIQTENDSLKRKLKDMRKSYNLVQPKKQTREITEAYLKNSSQADEMYQNLLEHSDEIIFLDSLVSFNNKRYMEYKDDHDEHVTQLNRNQFYSSVISKAIPADKKSYPVRWLILAGAAIASLLLAFFVLLILESVRQKKH